jgi:hypothetical protein
MILLHIYYIHMLYLCYLIVRYAKLRNGGVISQDLKG